MGGDERRVIPVGYGGGRGSGLMKCRLSVSARHVCCGESEAERYREG